MSDTELKPCPFCGGKAVFEIVNTKSSNYGVGFIFDVKCKDCEMKLTSRYSVDFSLNEDGEINFLNDRRSEAIKMWNRRANDE